MDCINCRGVHCTFVELIRLIGRLCDCCWCDFVKGRKYETPEWKSPTSPDVPVINDLISLVLQCKFKRKTDFGLQIWFDADKYLRLHSLRITRRRRSYALRYNALRKDRITTCARQVFREPHSCRARAELVPCPAHHHRLRC